MKEDVIEEQDEEQPKNNSTLWRKIIVWLIIISMATWSIGRFYIWNK